MLIWIKILTFSLFSLIGTEDWNEWAGDVLKVDVANEDVDELKDDDLDTDWWSVGERLFNGRKNEEGRIVCCELADTAIVTGSPK